tara:strand:- start:610 stop:1005 length:396 start_codon:yes stop_codon:yes gene_type:complete
MSTIKKKSPFDFINSINYSKKNLIEDKEDEKQYVPFIVNRGLGYFQDTILLANEMNVNCHVDNKMQYDFLKNTVRKRKRFSKWLKAEDDEKLDIICKYFGYSRNVAKSVIDLFDSSAIEDIKKRLDTGGRK